MFFSFLKVDRLVHEWESCLGASGLRNTRVFCKSLKGSLMKSVIVLFRLDFFGCKGGWFVSGRGWSF